MCVKMQLICDLKINRRDQRDSKINCLTAPQSLVLFLYSFLVPYGRLTWLSNPFSADAKYFISHFKQQLYFVSYHKRQLAVSTDFDAVAVQCPAMHLGSDVIRCPLRQDDAVKLSKTMSVTPGQVDVRRPALDIVQHDAGIHHRTDVPT